MGIKLVHYKNKSTSEWGCNDGDKVFTIANSAGKTLAEMMSRDPVEYTPKNVHDSISKDSLEVLSPASAPCSIFCQGLNYREHVKETGSQVGKDPFNLFFMKAPSSLTSAIGTIYKPRDVTLLDYELELGLVIGKNQTIAGLVMANDISAREIQIAEEQWFHGKSFRGFCPLGPLVFLSDSAEWKRIAELRLQLWVNNELRQDTFVGQMIHPIEKTLADLTAFTDLLPGDLILTGTPAGVALEVSGKILPKLAKAFLSPTILKKFLIRSQKSNAKYLKIGDSIRSTIRTEDGSIDLGTQLLTVR